MYVVFSGGHIENDIISYMDIFINVDIVSKQVRKNRYDRRKRNEDKTKSYKKHTKKGAVKI